MCRLSRSHQSSSGLVTVEHARSGGGERDAAARAAGQARDGDDGNGSDGGDPGVAASLESGSATGGRGSARAHAGRPGRATAWIRCFGARRETMASIASHVPRELRIAANGFELGAQPVTGAVTVQELAVRLAEALAFIEIFDERGTLVCYWPAPLPNEGALEEHTTIDLGGRTTGRTAGVADGRLSAAAHALHRRARVRRGPALLDAVPSPLAPALVRRPHRRRRFAAFIWCRRRAPLLLALAARGSRAVVATHRPVTAGRHGCRRAGRALDDSHRAYDDVGRARASRPRGGCRDPHADVAGAVRTAAILRARAGSACFRTGGASGRAAGAPERRRRCSARPSWPISRWMRASRFTR